MLPHRDDTPADLDLGDLVMRVARDLRRSGMAAFEPYDLAPHHVRALRVVAHQGTMRLGELAQHLRVAPRSVTDVVDALESRGLARRSPDPDDRRAQVVELTDDARALVGRIDEARRAGAEAYFARLPAGERETLRRILLRLDADA
ncbi:MarR family winged helix-turn-helix transcriptional regulator [Phycicoccus duodecadis]|uniref:DNA-binding MarR family transcriptional regulator n=1 Tax=Phycicoccus duodecadis TaxID=173053 RepID=A0A2N3YLH6_9MICO|nr:MarR family transcriptional regulator [Phycicoccus duodecadis]PKW27721.1 DNA-binding MarR family transcriptional regulator [Phycicoccus duodecadis]